MKNYFSTHPDNTSAIELFTGLLESLGSSLIDPQFVLLLRQGSSAGSIGVSLGNHISTTINDLKISTKEQYPFSENQKLQRVCLLLKDAHAKNDRLSAEVKQAQIKVSSYKRDLEQALTSLSASRSSFEKEQQKNDHEIKELREKLINLNRIVARQEIQLQGLLGEDRTAQNA